ncbi:endoglucanase 8-like [Andrographis paniculata]|uniref:endoglucanase 8-like n=1 Tax=Andrographis paniculata TaxID=175694 RepID=UPI0021E8DEC6|nr:endoglucanase 8-like [Andrographis paniculata]
MTVDLVSGYYDAGDNVKFHFPMAYTGTMLAWSILKYGGVMGRNLPRAMEALRWATDFFIKCTAKPGVVFAQVGDPKADHNCWERPKDMDTPRIVYAVTKTKPGSEVSGKMVAAMAAASIVFKNAGDRSYFSLLRDRAEKVFRFADAHRGFYNDNIGYGVCLFYCDYNGYQDELVWAATWLNKATKNSMYWSYIVKNFGDFKPNYERLLLQFGWDAKHGGIDIILSQVILIL